MKFGLLLKTKLIIFASVLCFHYVCAVPIKELTEYEKFELVAKKGDGDIKSSFEIAEFINSLPEDKEKWDSLVNKIRVLVKKEEGKKKSFESNSIVVNYKTIVDELASKKKKLEEGIDKIIEQDSKVKEIKEKMNKLSIEQDCLEKERGAFYKKNIDSIKKKQKNLKKLKCEFLGGDLNVPFNKYWELYEEVEKTKEYKDLEEQLKPLKDKEKKEFSNKIRANYDLLDSLHQELENKRKDKISSKDLSPILKKLSEEIEKLEVRNKKLGDEYFKLSDEESKNIESDKIIEDIFILTNDLLNLFKKMLKTAK